MPSLKKAYSQLWVSMSMCKIIGITNRHLCENDYFKQIDKIADMGLEALVIREKDLSDDEYFELASKVLDICNGRVKCIIHKYYEVANRLNCDAIHLPLHILRKDSDRLREFNTIGASVHSVEEAIEAQELGATYITAGHIFATDCKKGVPPRGVEFLNAVCKSVNIPVYGIGGINKNNINEVIKNGAAGGCIMSGIMR